MNPKLLLCLAVVLSGGLISCPAAPNAVVFENGKWMAQQSMGLSDVRNFQPTPEIKLDRFGGWLEKTEKATGFFHTARIDGRWWLIDPDGHFFLSVGINSVSPVSTGAKDENSNDEPGGNPEWARQTLSLLRQYGFNTLGCWSATTILGKQPEPMPYCLHLNLMAHYRKERQKKYPATGESDVIYPFDPEFESFCDRHAESLEKTRNDPWLLGCFSDNELPFSEKGIVQRYLGCPSNDPGHIAAANFMAQRNRTRPTKEDDRDFLQLVVGEYYRKVAAAIKKHDPNHLFLGSRFHGLALASPAIFLGAGPYADVVSVNYYRRWTPENNRIENWARLGGKPILITEWYAKATGSSLPNQTGAGFLVKAQKDRVIFYQNFTLTLLQNPDCVGWHWFKYRDGAENNPGIVNAEGAPYTLLLDAMKEINAQAYPLRETLIK